MRKKTVAIWRIVIIAVIIGVSIGYMKYDKYASYHDAWRSHWGITVPASADFKVVFESGPRFHGDGEGYFILDYNEQQLSTVKDQGFWQLINEKSSDALDGEVSRFKYSVLQMYRDEQAKYENLYQNNPTEYGEGDQYYYQAKDNGSYCIIILNVEKKRIYLMEWTQGYT